MICYSREKSWRNPNGDACGAGQIRFVIVGIGLNVNQEKFPGKLFECALPCRVESGKAQFAHLDCWCVASEIRRPITASSCGTAWRAWWRTFESASSFKMQARAGERDGLESYTGHTAGLGPRIAAVEERDDGALTTVMRRRGGGALMLLDDRCGEHTRCWEFFGGEELMRIGG